MKKQKLIKLTTEIPHINALGIVSKAGSHRISWLINSILNISLSLLHSEDNMPYSIYFFQNEDRYFKLFSNKNPETILLPKYKNINYLFFAINTDKLPDELKQDLKKEDDIVAVFEFSANDFPKKFLKEFIL